MREGSQCATPEPKGNDDDGKKKKKKKKGEENHNLTHLIVRN